MKDPLFSEGKMPAPLSAIFTPKVTHHEGNHSRTTPKYFSGLPPGFMAGQQQQQQSARSREPLLVDEDILQQQQQQRLQSPNVPTPMSSELPNASGTQNKPFATNSGKRK